MKKKRFTEEQIVKYISRLDAGEKSKDLCREIGIHMQTLYKWRSKYGGMEVSEVKQLRALKEENMKLKKLVADLSLDIVMLKDINSQKF